MSTINECRVPPTNHSIVGIMPMLTKNHKLFERIEAIDRPHQVVGRVSSANRTYGLR